MSADVTARLKTLERVRITARGRVQGVGFRPTLYRALTARGCAGSIRNTPEGVVLEVEGPPSVLKDVVTNFRELAPARAEIVELQVQRVSPTGEQGFAIESSSSSGRSLLPIPPDLALCAECQVEVDTAGSRRHAYPFNTCTACGPRFSIARKVPFDRGTNAMDEFPPCKRCAREYADAADRRFHAQTISCPECGPRLSFLAEDGSRRAEPLRTACEMLVAGKIVAIKGIGGFHLACDATREEAVRELRRRKARPHKPFALMVRDMDTCRRMCDVDEFEAAVLCSPQAPIVLLRRRNDAPVCRSVAPDLNYLGMMVAYTPLHRMLWDAPRMPVALVMTSCNRADEPIATTEEHVLGRLGDIVDGVLTNDRPIENRCDDSVVATFRGRLLPVRRSRGYVPEPILLARGGPPVLATGAMWKNTFALTSGRRVFLSPHIGDVSDADNAEHFARSFEKFSELLRLEPEVVVCDMHPDYPTTAFAHKLAQERGLALMEVQHHHAHATSCMAENGCNDEVIAVSLDGTGYGADGAVWGGEFLVASMTGYRRVCHLEYVRMPGGEQAVRFPDRMAVAHLAHALGNEAALARMAPAMGRRQCELTLQVMEKHAFSPPTSSCGRLFDAVSALLGLRHEVTYDAQAACELETICSLDEKGRYGFAREGENLRVQEIFRGICRDMDKSTVPSVIAARFHNTVAAMVTETCSQLRDETGIRKVALSGGVMQNRYLVSRIVPALEKERFEVLLQSVVPANDAGICLGQAATALARRRL